MRKKYFYELEFVFLMSSSQLIYLHLHIFPTNFYGQFLILSLLLKLLKHPDFPGTCAGGVLDQSSDINAGL